MNAADAELDQVLSKYKAEWIRLKNDPDALVLKLAILRNISNDLHASKSRLVGIEGPEQFRKKILEIENALMRLDDVGVLSMLLTLANIKKGTPKRPKSDSNELNPPKPLFDIIPESKLIRFDRHWEARIASSAYSKGWNFFSLELNILLKRADETNTKVNQTLWPDAVVLFIEAANRQAPPPNWIGRWLLTTPPNVTKDEIKSSVSEVVQTSHSIELEVLRSQ